MTKNMKTAISVEDSLMEQTDEAARAMGPTRAKPESIDPEASAPTQAQTRQARAT